MESSVDCRRSVDRILFHTPISMDSKQFNEILIYAQLRTVYAVFAFNSGRWTNDKPSDLQSAPIEHKQS